MLFLKFAIVSVFLHLTACIEYNFNTPSDHDIKKGRISGIKDRDDKDIIIGGLVRIHSHDGGGKCGSVLLHKSVENMEAMLYAIDAINSDKSLLPNIKLGYDIRDTCVSESVALDESADLIVSNGQIDLESCENVVTSNATVPVVGVIGAIVSFVSIPVASFFRLFKMPQISFSSTSPILNDRDRYSYFFRTIPSDDQQAQAMIDIILHFQWDHVSTIYSNNLYGQPGIIQFHRLAFKHKICIDVNEGLEDSYDENTYKRIAGELFDSSSNVVVFFASLHHVKPLLTAVSDLAKNNSKQFLWIASDGWSELVDPEFNDITVGKWGIAPLTETVQSFDEYYSLLTPETNARNPWFPDFYQLYFSCNSSSNCPNASIPTDPKYTQDSFDPLVIDAVYSFAHAINNFLFENCEQPITWFTYNQTCKGSEKILGGETLRHYLYSLNFTSPTGSEVNFNENGAVNGKYQILNYQFCEHCSHKYTLVKVGTWDGTSSGMPLQLYSNIEQQFGVDHSGNIKFQLQSQCQQCLPGYIKREVVSSCCGTCDPCLGQNYTNVTNSPHCEQCPENTWGNSPLNGSDECTEIEESYLKPHDAWAIALMILAFVGLLSTAFVVGTFVWFWRTPIVKSSGREQMVLLLIGITLCFILTISFLVKPSETACAFQRIGQWFCISLILSALLIKLVRIARIFLQKTASARPKLIGPWYQVLFTFLLVGCEMVFVIISLLVVHPDITKTTLKNKDNQIDFPLVIINCAQPHIALIVIQMMYCTLLLIASNVLAILTIRFPENFNESKYVAFSTFSLGLIWIAFVFTYFATNAEPQHQNAVLSFSIQLSALAVLACMFVPRMFIMIFRPKQNKVTLKGSPSSTFNTQLKVADNTVTTTVE